MLSPRTRKPLTAAQKQAQRQHTRNWRERVRAKGARYVKGRLTFSGRGPTAAELEEREMDRRAAEWLARVDGGCR